MSYQYRASSAVPAPVQGGGELVYEIPISPTGGFPSTSRAPSRPRDAPPYIYYDHGDGNYDSGHLFVAGTSLARSSSVKDSYRGQMNMEINTSGRPRSTYYSRGGREEEDYYRGRRGKHYYAGSYGDESAYTSSSRDSREHSRHDHARRPRRSNSCSSHDGYDQHVHNAHHTHHAHTAAYPPADHWANQFAAPPPQQGLPGSQLVGYGPRVVAPPVDQDKKELEGKIEALRKELEISKLVAERNRKAEEETIELRKKEDEIAKAVQAAVKAEEERRIKAAEEAAKKQRELQAAVKAEEERKARAAEEAAKRQKELDEVINTRARKLIEEEQAKEKAEKEKAAAEKARIEAAAQVHASSLLGNTLDLTKPTYTKFSKAFLCKEALDEKKIMYHEQGDSFIVHRWVARVEQEQLWKRTKEIREYQEDYKRRFKEAADKAPIMRGPGEQLFKMVKVGDAPPVQVPVLMVPKKGNRPKW